MRPERKEILAWFGMACQEERREPSVSSPFWWCSQADFQTYKCTHIMHTYSSTRRVPICVCAPEQQIERTQDSPIVWREGKKIFFLLLFSPYSVLRVLYCWILIAIPYFHIADALHGLFGLRERETVFRHLNESQWDCVVLCSTWGLIERTERERKKEANPTTAWQEGGKS